MRSILSWLGLFLAIALLSGCGGSSNNNGGTDDPPNDGRTLGIMVEEWRFENNQVKSRRILQGEYPVITQGVQFRVIAGYMGQNADGTKTVVEELPFNQVRNVRFYLNRPNKNQFVLLSEPPLVRWLDPNVREFYHIDEQWLDNETYVAICADLTVGDQCPTVTGYYRVWCEGQTPP